jgi:hypothetical protein
MRGCFGWCCKRRAVLVVGIFDRMQTHFESGEADGVLGQMRAVEELCLRLAGLVGALREMKPGTTFILWARIAVFERSSHASFVY